jgi:hypothetical protein
MKLILLILLNFTLFLSATRSLHAQQYKFEKVGPFVSDDEGAIAINDRGELIGDNLKIEGGLFYAKVDGSKVVNLTDVGFDVVTDINNSGTVLGQVKVDGKRTAALWSLKDGLKILPKLENFDQSQGLALNDKDEVIGVNFYRDYYPLQYRAGGYCTNSRAFYWSRKTGLKRISKRPEIASVAYDINQSGRIVYGEQTQTWESYRSEILNSENVDLRRECYFDIILSKFFTKKIHTSPLILRAHNGPHTAWISEGKFDGKIAQISSDNYVVVSTRLYKPNRQRPFNQRFYEGTSKLGIGGIGLHNYSIYTRRRGSVAIECLLPQNTKISNSNLLVSNIAQQSSSPVDFFKGDSFVFNTLISGDAKFQQIILAKKLPAKKFGPHYNHCLAIEMTSVSKSCPKQNSSEEYNFNEGGTCSHRLRVTEYSHNDPIPNVSLTLVYAKRIPTQLSAITPRGGGDNCGAFYDECYSSKEHPIPGATSSAGEITFSANISHNYYANIYLADPRFYVSNFGNSYCIIGVDRPGQYRFDYSDGDPYYEPDNDVVACADLP